MRMEVNNLSPDEIVIMETLWNHENIGFNAILQYAEQEGGYLNRNTLLGHLESLCAKDMIRVSREEKILLNNTTIKQYSAICTREEYLAAVLENNPIFDESIFPGILASIMKNISSQETINKSLRTIEQEKKRRK